jgi:hypothetical protein
VTSIVGSMPLSRADIGRLRGLVERALEEVLDYADGESRISPDDPIALGESYAWGEDFLNRLRALENG